MNELERTASRIRTRWIAVTALIISNITFGSGLLVFAYMKSPLFEEQLLGQVTKHIDWIIRDEISKNLEYIKTEKKPKVSYADDPNQWFWDYMEERNKEYIEWETKGKWEQ